MGSDEGTRLSNAKKCRRRLLNLALVRCHPKRWRWSSWLLLGVAAGVLMFVIGFVGLWTFRHWQCYSREAGIQWKPAPIINISRPCPKPNPEYQTVAAAAKGHEKPRICLTTLTDSQSQSTWQRLLRCRDFDGVAKRTYPNLAAYAKKHGYAIYDASPLIDTSRPPAWSKVLAVQKLLRPQRQQGDEEEDDDKCDWVFWVDADIVIMSSTVAIESFLPTSADDDDDDSTIDLLVTMDRRLTANSGAWLIRNTDWSREFLQAWWGMRRWVREPGLSLSGDNAAFGHLIEQRLQEQSSIHGTATERIRLVPRCTFNSFAVFVPDDDASPPDVPMERQDWYLSENFYHDGDFIAHASGVDQKEACVEMLLAEAT